MLAALLTDAAGIQAHSQRVGMMHECSSLVTHQASMHHDDKGNVTLKQYTAIKEYKVQRRDGDDNSWYQLRMATPLRAA